MSAQDEGASSTSIAAAIMDTPNDTALDSFQPHSPTLDDNAALTGRNDNQSIELADDTDDDAILDLTQDATESNRENGSNSGEPNSRGSSESDSEALEFLREAGLSEEDLHALGIDLEEIRAQRQLEKQAQRDLEYARRVQEQLDAEARQPSSSQMPPPTTASPQTPISTTTSTTMTPSPQIPLSFTQQHQQLYSPVSYNSAPTFSHIHPYPSSMTDHRHQPQVKRIKSEHPPSAIELMRQQLQNHGIGSSSSSSFRNTQSKPVTILDEDDDVIDLTNDDAGVGSSSQASLWPPNRNGVGSSSSAMASSSSTTQLAKYLYSDDDEDEDDYSYYSNPYIAMINQTLNSACSIPSSSTFRPFYASSVATSRANFEARYNLPYNRYASEYVRPLNDQQTEQELRQLLESIQNHDENTKPEDRIGTPERLAVNLMEHQKVGLRWMTRQEESVNKGGMLSDDMGLGKVSNKACIDSHPIDMFVTQN